jgi:LysR family pca operon transcriptional activator
VVIDARMKIRHLQCFQEVARLGHVGRAADQLAVTQPAVSKTLRELEDILSVRLFARTRKGLELTPAGELFQAPRRERAGGAPAGDRQRRPGRERGDTAIRVGALPTVAVRIMPRAVQDLVRRGRTRP